jgi:hypothetical protein
VVPGHLRVLGVVELWLSSPKSAQAEGLRYQKMTPNAREEISVAHKNEEYGLPTDGALRDSSLSILY